MHGGDASGRHGGPGAGGSGGGSVRFCAIQHCIRLPQQQFGRDLDARRRAAQADADGHLRQGRGQLPPGLGLAGTPDRLRDQARAAIIGVGQQDHEFVPAQPRGVIGRAARDGGDDAADPAQALVPSGVTVPVVHRLEPVDVEQHQGDRRRHPYRLAARSLERRFEGAAIEQAGQGIGHGDLRQFGHRLHQGRDVGVAEIGDAVLVALSDHTAPATVRKLDLERSAEEPQIVLHRRDGVVGGQARARPGALHHLEQREADDRLPVRHVVQRVERRIGGDDPVRPIDDAGAVGEMIQQVDRKGGRVRGGKCRARALLDQAPPDAHAPAARDPRRCDHQPPSTMLEGERAGLVAMPLEPVADIALDIVAFRAAEPRRVEAVEVLPVRLTRIDVAGMFGKERQETRVPADGAILRVEQAEGDVERVEEWGERTIDLTRRHEHPPLLDRGWSRRRQLLDGDARLRPLPRP